MNGETMTEQNNAGEPTAAVNESVGQEAQDSQPKDEPKVEFSPDQQKWLNQREKAHKDEVRQLRESLSAFERKLTDLDPSSFDNVLNDAKQRDDRELQVELLTKRIQEMEQQTVQSKTEGAIREAIDTFGVDPKYAKFVSDYIKGNIQADAGNLKVINPETGAQRFTSDGTKELNVSDLVQEVLTEYPAFAPKAPTGSGTRVNSNAGQPEDNSLSAQLKKLDPRNPADQMKLKKLLDEQTLQQSGGPRTLNLLNRQ